MPPASRIRFTFSHALGSKPSTGISVRTWSRLLTSQPAFFRAGSMSSFLVVASLGFVLDNFGAPVVLSQRQLYTRGVLLSKCVLYGFQYHIFRHLTGSATRMSVARNTGALANSIESWVTLVGKSFRSLLRKQK